VDRFSIFSVSIEFMTIFSEFIEFCIAIYLWTTLSIISLVCATIFQFPRRVRIRLRVSIAKDPTRH
jgi:hypothetical protein